ncbi:Ubiquinone/menaquinone biosynthesis C-methyltransferase UbiE [Diplonema papillatum]|nr:Ubiquinone/menaquinone biosynthesis C-methyltransferase UbiE [Diplonema papillatum]|eukprot:gene22837-34993_t
MSTDKNNHTDKAIGLCMNLSWIYNQSWEDPKVDVKHYRLDKGSRICMLTTGGDNVLDYLIEDPEYIDTFDMNEHQNYLLDMKLACVKALEYEDAFAILARQDYETFTRLYPTIRKQLGEMSRIWWDGNQHRMKNWHLSGSCKLCANGAIGILKTLGCWGMIEEIQGMENPTLDNQRAIYAKYRSKVQFAARMFQKAINYFISAAGVPERQYCMYDERDSFIPDLLDYLLQNTLLLADNYFYSSYVVDGWTEQSCPRYLKKENFAAVKARADRVRIITAMLTDGVQLPEARRNYTRFVLLDHQDWLTEEQIAKSWNVLSQVGAPGALVGYRSYGVLPFGCLSNLKFLVKGQIGRSTPNEYSDRVGMYNGIFCAELPAPGEGPIMLTDPQWKEQTLFGSLKTFGDMMLAPLYTTFSRDHSSFLESFYESQAESYDAYRANMLHGKRALMWAVPWSSKPKSLLLFGGGTGDLLEYIANIVDSFDEIVVLDLCAALLNQAKKRAARYGWSNVKVVQGDATQYVPPKGGFDVVLSTYVFTMIPDWRLAIDKAWECVAPGGYLGASDFTTNPKEQWGVSQWMWKTTFSFDHVNLNPEHYKRIRSFGTPCGFRIESGSFPFVPLLKCPYYYAVQQKVGKKED